MVVLTGGKSLMRSMYGWQQEQPVCAIYAPTAEKCSVVRELVKLMGEAP
ncbi:MAG: hypothetical protein Q7J38_16950 [Gallionella sp.]|nr:hypothetical protein [Gallionella sp.]